ncbi:MAG: Spo0E family sporulation regulatory protein-aspartic acid phosphatase [Lachnospiraceae bacterium]|nr:Spo0E family sporulation regulatory protein-aspartic acid phosphatase [Lachnospiraceae bacterium]
MTQKERLKKQIERERTQLNFLIENGGKVEEVYRQSLIVDRLVERYLELAAV